jgi:hypothetical protein
MLVIYYSIIIIIIIIIIFNKINFENGIKENMEMGKFVISLIRLYMVI